MTHTKHRPTHTSEETQSNLSGIKKIKINIRSPQAIKNITRHILKFVDNDMKVLLTGDTYSIIDAVLVQLLREDFDDLVRIGYGKDFLTSETYSPWDNQKIKSAGEWKEFLESIGDFKLVAKKKVLNKLLEYYDPDVIIYLKDKREKYSETLMTGNYNGLKRLR